MSHISTLVRHPSTRVGGRYPDGAGATGASRPSDDDDLHPCPESGRTGCAESSGHPIAASALYIRSGPRLRLRAVLGCGFRSVCERTGASVGGGVTVWYMGVSGHRLV